MILQVPYTDIERGLSEQQLEVLKKTGVLIVKGGVPKEVRVQSISHCCLPAGCSGQELSWTHIVLPGISHEPTV